MKKIFFNFQSEFYAIRTLFIWSSIVGIVYATFFKDFKDIISWVENFAKGGFVITVFGGTYLRMQAAKNREESKKTSSETNKLLSDTKRIVEKKFAEQSFRSEKNFLQTIRTMNDDNDGYYRFKFWFECHKDMIIQIIVGENLYHCTLKVLGKYSQMSGGFIKDYYICETDEFSEPDPPIPSKCKVAVYFSSGMKISEYVDADSGTPDLTVFKFNIVGRMGAVSSMKPIKVKEIPAENIERRDIDCF